MQTSLFIYTFYSLSYVVVRRHPYSLNIFSSETTGPIKVKFHMELLWNGRTKVCSNGPGHMTKMAAMAIYGKNLKKSSSLEPKGQWPWILVCIIGCLSTTKSAQMMTLGWPWHILRQGQIWSLMLLYGEKGKTVDFSETIVVCDLKLATDDRSDKKFLLPRGYIHVLNHEKTRNTRGPLVLYSSPECWGYVESEQTWKYISTQCCISFHPCRSILKQIWPCHKKQSRSTQGHHMKYC